MRSSAALFSCSLALLLALAGRAGAADIVPCAPGSAPFKEAEAALERLERVIQALQPGGDVAPANQALKDLLGHRCFALRIEHSRPIAAPSALSLKAFWQDGGASWLRSYLRAPGEADPHVVVPPDMRRSLALPAQAGHALAPWLCPVDDPGCGLETRGWQRRAEDAFAAHALDNGRLQPRHGEPRKEVAVGCLQDGKGDRSYRRWRQCLEERRELVPALPLGSFRAPQRGWLVLRGRRGHHSFCDEVRAYDLGTGAAYVAGTCGGLVLRRGGDVDGARTDAGRRLSVRAGVLPLENLREAAWMLLFAGEVDAVQRHGEHHLIPQGMALRWPRDLGFVSGMGMSSWVTSGQTTLSWSLQDQGRVLRSGTLVWPESSEAGPHHAAALLQIAEAALREGCPPAAAPAVLPAAARPGVSALDARPESLSEAQRQAEAALRQYRCQK